MISQSRMPPGQDDQPLQAWHPLTQQQLFRGLLHSFSYPGRVVRVGQPQPLFSALATLVDQGLPLADPGRLLSKLFLRRLGCQVTPPEEAAFIVCEGHKAPDFTPRLGSLESPETGATLLVSVNAFTGGKRYRLRGPGIADTTLLEIDGLDDAWIKAHQRWRSHYPMGADMLLVSGDSWVALPRTLTIMEEIR
ncbi:MAG: phosphonate C-P lyase system protein PhnH [Marinobacter sp.]|nr:phosphonate C-P lyase system protein PhnH [Marinobacter sp.]